MDVYSNITADDLITNQNTVHPSSMADPQEICLFYETAISREEGSHPQICLKLYDNYYTWALKNLKGDDGVEKRFKILQDFTHRLRKEESLYQDDKYVYYWAHYANSVQEIFDVYHYMEIHRIGQTTYNYYINYAKDVEKELRDFRKADKIYRTGLDMIEKDRHKKKFQKDYDRFAKRMEGRINDMAEPLRKISTSSCSSSKIFRKRNRAPLIESRRRDDSDITPIKASLMPQSQNFLDPCVIGSREKQPSFTQFQYNNDQSCLIYVDSDQRDQFIPKGSMLVDKYYTELDIRNLPYEIFSESKIHETRSDMKKSWVSCIDSYTTGVPKPDSPKPQESNDSEDSEDLEDLKDLDEVMVFGGKINWKNKDSEGNLLSAEELRAEMVLSHLKKKSNNKLKPILKVKRDCSSGCINNDSSDSKTTKSFKSISSSSVNDSMQKIRQRFNNRNKHKYAHQDKENDAISQNSKYIFKKPITDSLQKKWRDNLACSSKEKSIDRSVNKIVSKMGGLKLSDFRKYQPKFEEKPDRRDPFKPISNNVNFMEKCNEESQSEEENVGNTPMKLF
ncbi:unnamed protein product [Moneuplotes crassus]|uniref:BUB1 N-terminal domain-containing protein n=1 Tax=Euplotes crassus TaxID=5936 RepID=A0AAD1U762_EUPCR|nr:unnamed protein product [Moneuplotes crassus]